MYISALEVIYTLCVDEAAQQIILSASQWSRVFSSGEHRVIGWVVRYQFDPTKTLSLQPLLWLATWWSTYALILVLFALSIQEGGFLFKDFTLACCQPIVLNNCCPPPVLGHHPFLVLTSPKPEFMLGIRVMLFDNKTAQLKWGF